MFDYRLHVFRCVAEEQSLSRAARRLHISQPAVSQHIRTLEELFQTPLFQRSSVGVTLTEAGMILLEHVRETEARHESVKQQITAGRGALAGRLRLGCSTTVTGYFLPAVLVALKKNHPAVEIDVLTGNSDFVIGALLARQIDLGLIESPCRRRDLRVQGFYEDEIIVIGGHRYAGRHLTLRDLKKEPLIFREVGSGTREVVEAALQKQGLPLKDLTVVQELPSTEAIKRVVAGGMGVGFVSRLAVEGELRSRVLVELKVRGLSMRRAFSAILPLGPDPVGLRQLVLSCLGRPS